jgi:hypothetical protein
MNINQTVKTIAYWFLAFSWKNKGYSLIFYAGLSGSSFKLLYSPASGSLLELTFNNEISSWILAILILIGSLLLFIEAVRDLKKRAIIFQHLGIGNIKTFNIDKARPIWDKLFRAEAHNIDVWQYYEDGIVTNPKKALEKTTSILHAIENTSQTNSENLKFYYGGLVQVPFAFTAGAILNNTMDVDVYDWNRVESKAYLIESGNEQVPFKITLADINEFDASIAIEIEITYPLNHSNTINAVGDIPTLKIHAHTPELDNASNIETQETICKEFHKLLDQYSNVNTIHIFIAAQNSLVFQLGRQISKRVHPTIVIWQYEKQNKVQNPWGVKISKNGYEIYENNEKNIEIKVKSI